MHAVAHISKFLITKYRYVNYVVCIPTGTDLLTQSNLEATKTILSCILSTLPLFFFLLSLCLFHDIGKDLLLSRSNLISRFSRKAEHPNVNFKLLVTKMHLI